MSKYKTIMLARDLFDKKGTEKFDFMKRVSKTDIYHFRLFGLLSEPVHKTGREHVARFIKNPHDIKIEPNI